MLKKSAVICIAIVGLLGFAVAQSDTATGAFTATLQIKAPEGSATKRAPLLKFSGKIAQSGDKFRLDLLNELTAEQQLYILDSGADKAWMLFPDTLNGLSANLSQMDDTGLARYLHLASRGEYSQVPEGWNKPSSAKDQLEGKQVTHLTYVLGDAKNPKRKVHLWHDSSRKPIRLVIEGMATKLTVTFSSFTRGGTVEASRFVPAKDYTIRGLAKGEKPPLPGGIPGGVVD